MFFVSRRNIALLLGWMGAGHALDGAASSPPTAVAWGLVTIQDGETFLLRGTDRFALSEGVALRSDDMIEVPPATKLLRLETADRSSLSLGPGSRILLAPRIAGGRRGGPGVEVYLLHGWLKLTAAKGAEATVQSPALEAAVLGGSAVIAVRPGKTEVFAEAGETAVRLGKAPARTLKPGEFLLLPAGADSEPQFGNRPTRAFVESLPRSFMDSIPLRAERFKDRVAEPKALGAAGYPDAQPWIDADSPALRKAYMPRWRPLLRDPAFRRSLASAIRSHPEWEPVLFPPAPKRASP